MRPWRNRATRPLSYNGLVWVLTNKFCAGIVEWNGGEYRKIRLSPGMAQDLHAALEAELVERQDRSAADRDLQTKRLTVLKGQRRKLLEAYYAVPSTSPCSARSRIGSGARRGRPRSCSSRPTPAWRNGSRSSTWQCEAVA